MNKHKIGDIVNTMGHWFRVIGVTETGYKLDLLTIEEVIQHESNLESEYMKEQAIEPKGNFYRIRYMDGSLSRIIDRATKARKVAVRKSSAKEIVKYVDGKEVEVISIQ